MRNVTASQLRAAARRAHRDTRPAPIPRGARPTIVLTIQRQPRHLDAQGPKPGTLTTTDDGHLRLHVGRGLSLGGHQADTIAEQARGAQVLHIHAYTSQAAEWARRQLNVAYRLADYRASGLLPPGL